MTGTSPLLDRIPIGSIPHDPDEILNRFLDWATETGLEPYPAQKEALLEFITGRHVILNTPTGSGKSLVALGVHFKALCEKQRSFYTAPTKALANQKFFSLCELFGAAQVGMLTGDASINRDAPIICCTAEILCNMSLRQGEKCNAPYVVMDEFHYYGDRERGTAWQVPLLLLPNTRFLLMSATLGDTKRIGEYLHANTQRRVAHVFSDERPVPLDFEYRETPIHETIESLYDAGKTPIYIVSFTQRECAQFAQALTSLKLLPREKRRALREEIKGFSFDTPYGKSIRRFLSHGIGIHHAGLLPKYRLISEKLAQQGKLKVVCGTDTLGVGVNIPIRTVVFSKLSKFDGENVRLLSAREFKQIAGRAGRKGFDVEGTVVCQAPEHVVANRQASKSSGIPSRRLRKRSPSNIVQWNRNHFRKLIDGPPESLVSRLQISHGVLIRTLQRESDVVGTRGGYGDLIDVVDRSHESAQTKRKLRREAAELFRSLRHAKIIGIQEDPKVRRPRALVAENLQRDFSLHQTLSLFLIEALSILAPEEKTYAYDLTTLVEAILEQPWPILYAQERKARRILSRELKAAGVPYEERRHQLETISYPKPNAQEIDTVFKLFAIQHPWVKQENIHPKSIAREMAEGSCRFEDYVRTYRLERVEGLLLRYLSQVYGTLLRTVPDRDKTDEVNGILTYLRELIATVDSSLLDEWESRMEPHLPLSPIPAVKRGGHTVPTKKAR